MICTLQIWVTRQSSSRVITQQSVLAFEATVVPIFALVLATVAVLASRCTVLEASVMVTSYRDWNSKSRTVAIIATSGQIVGFIAIAPIFEFKVALSHLFLFVFLLLIYKDLHTKGDHLWLTFLAHKAKWICLLQIMLKTQQIQNLWIL